MSSKPVLWGLLCVIAFAAVLLLNHWAAYQPLSTMAYSGMVLALCGLANVIVPFRFLGVRKRVTGALAFAGGVAMAAASLLWPAPVLHVAQPGNVLDAIMPEYQFSEKHSTRIHARPEQVMEAVRQSTFGDMRSLDTLLRIRGAVLRVHEAGAFPKDRRILDAFAASGYVSSGSDHEIVMAGGANVRARRPLMVHTVQEFAAYQEAGAIKMAFDFTVQAADGGWCTLHAETRVLATDNATRSGMGRYWRLIVPGSGLLRLEWLAGIKRRAESRPEPER